MLRSHKLHCNIWNMSTFIHHGLQVNYILYTAFTHTQSKPKHSRKKYSTVDVNGVCGSSFLFLKLFSGLESFSACVIWLNNGQW